MKIVKEIISQFIVKFSIDLFKKCNTKSKKTKIQNGMQ